MTVRMLRRRCLHRPARSSGSGGARASLIVFTVRAPYTKPRALAAIQLNRTLEFDEKKATAATALLAIVILYYYRVIIAPQMPL